MNFDFGTIFTFIASMLSSGPWGLVGVVGGGIIAGIVSLVAIRYANKLRDQQDLDNAGADAGRTAVDLRNQADANREFMESERRRIELEGPPK